MDVPTKALFNPLGHDLLGKLRKIRRDVGNLTRRVARYREIRKSLLNTGLPTTGLPQSQRRNEAAHGGNIKEDYFLIMKRRTGRSQTNGEGRSKTYMGSSSRA
ncbi:hypothetical protein RU639_007632 [Aspergillus parasiticus]